ncbi:MAG: hypothetical protein QF704_04375, partial [Anaerolineales bacterium]|nr:hypothetical protein [Anaerolineales bacterium]
MKIIHRSIFLVLYLTALYGQLTVSTVSSGNANGTYSKGDGPIDINVTLGETVVVVSGTPQLTLETGLGTPYPADAVAVYTGGSGTNVLTFRYTIQTGDYSADLNYESTSALNLNGASINDSNGDPVVSFILPDLASANSLAGTGIGSGKDFVIKTITATADITLRSGTGRNSNTIGLAGHMNADNKVTFTLNLFGDDAKSLALGGYLNGEVTPYIAWDEYNNDPENFVYNAQFDISSITATTLDIDYTASNVQSSNASAIKHADNFDIRLKIVDGDFGNLIWLNIDNWGNAGVTDYLLYDGD